MKILMTCKQVSEPLSQSQERPLGLAEKFGLGAQLLMCAGCRNFGKQLALIRAAVKRYVERGSR